MEKQTRSFGRKTTAPDSKPSSGRKKGVSKTSYNKDKKYSGERKKNFTRSDDARGDEKHRFGNKPYKGNAAYSKSYHSEHGDKKYGSSSEKQYKARFRNAKPQDKKRTEFTGNDRNSKYESKKNIPEKKQAALLDTRIEIALQALIDVEKNGKYINLAFKNNEKLNKLDKKDRAYVMRILYGVTEKSYTVNWLLQKVLKEKRVKPWLNAILKIGVYQIYYMRIDDKDAIAQASELCRKYVSDELCGFVTAVLNKLSESKDEYDPELYRFKNTSERLAVIYSYPEWLIDMWLSDYGTDTVNALLSTELQRAINLRVSAKASKNDVFAELDEAGIKYSDGILYNTISVSDTVNVEALNAYQNGLVTVQGIGSMLTVDVLDVKKNSIVLDACAAPGGKTFYIAEKTTAQTESCDLHEHRVELIKKGAQRLLLENIHAVCRDMTEFDEGYVEAFDRVLIDAPCSGLGMINSKPDIKNNATAEELTELAKIQSQLLDTCSKYVKVGGLLVYSTCTVSKQENEMNIKKFISEHSDFELVDIDTKIPDMLNYITDEKTVTILPSKYNADAFFIAALRRI